MVDYNVKITEIENKLANHNHDKYIDTSEFNNLAADVFNARLAQAKLITKTEFYSKLSSLGWFGQNVLIFWCRDEFFCTYW